jgi:hypothetical protein
VGEDAAFRSAASLVQLIRRDGDDPEPVFGEVPGEGRAAGRGEDGMPVADDVESQPAGLGRADDDRVGVELAQESLTGPVEGLRPVGDRGFVQDGERGIEVIQARVDEGELNGGQVEEVANLRATAPGSERGPVPASRRSPINRKSPSPSLTCSACWTWASPSRANASAK